MHDDLLDRSRALREVHGEMYRCLERMADMQLIVFPCHQEESYAETEVTYEAYCSLRDQMQQQTMLEMCIAEEFCPPHNDTDDQPDDDNDDDNDNDEAAAGRDVELLDKLYTRESTAAERGDQDALTTMLACLTYPPYLRPQDLQAFLALPLSINNVAP